MREGNYRPVFIGGCDRSGTTLLGSMLGGGSNGITTPESQFIWEVYYNLSSQASANLNDICKEINRNFRYKIWGLGPYDFKKEEVKDNNYSSVIKGIVNDYAIKEGKGYADIWVDHTPASMRHIQLLLNFFPDAKFIHMVRDGRAIANSVLNLHWGPSDIIESSSWWTANIAYGLAAESYLDSKKIIRIKYEDLIQKPKETLIEICEFVGVDFEDCMLDGGGFNTPDYTQSQHKLVGNRVDKGRALAWDQSLTQRQIELFEYKTADLLPYLGYQKKIAYSVCPPTKKERLFYLINKLTYTFSKRIKQYYRKRKHV